MRILCWNVNSLEPTRRNAILKFGSFKGLFDEYKADAVCLQETKLRDDKLTKDLCCVEGYQSFWSISRERKGYSGVATYASTAYAPVSCQADCLGSGEDDIDREGRVVITDHSAFVLVNVYVPNAGEPPERSRLGIKLKFLRALKERCDALVAEGREVLLVGDFNIAASPQDVHPTFDYDSLYAPEERAALLALLEGGYTDVWRRLHPDAADVYTVWDEYTGAKAFNRGLRIDYFLATPGLLNHVVSCEMVPTPPKWSDHTGMVLELRDVDSLPPHPPCPQWTKLLRRFHDATQPSVAALFGRKKDTQQQRRQQQQQEGPPGSRSAAVAGSAAGAARTGETATGTAAGPAAAAPGAEGMDQQPDGGSGPEEGRVNGDSDEEEKAAGKQPLDQLPADTAGRGMRGGVAEGGEAQRAEGTAAVSAPAGGRLACGPEQQEAEQGQEAPTGSGKAGAGPANAGAGGGGSSGGGGRKRKAAAAPAAGSGKRGGKTGGGSGGGGGGQRSIASFLRPPSQD